jgi:peroxiredoxin
MSRGALAVALSWLALASPAPALADTDRALAELFLFKPRVAQPAKDFSVSTPTGKGLVLRDLKGKVVLLNFWATWCPPCLREMPSMEGAHQRYRARGLAVVGIAVDTDPAVVTPYLKERKITFPIGFDPKSRVADAYGVRALPATFLIDRAGQVTALAMGPREWDGPAARAVFDSMLK